MRHKKITSHRKGNRIREKLYSDFPRHVLNVLIVYYLGSIREIYNWPR